MNTSNLPSLPNVAARLQWARERARLTQEQLAAKAGVTRDVIAKTEAGITRMPKSIEKIAAALDVPPAWLAFGHEQIENWDEDTLELAEAYNRLPGAVRQAVRDLIKSVDDKK